MTNCDTPQSRTSILAAAGFSANAATEWNDAAPDGITTFSSDRHTYSDFWLKSARLIARLPTAAHRNEPEHAAAAVIHETARRARTRFLHAHVEAVYDILTDRRSRRLRVEQLVAAAADVVPGLVPGPQEIAAEDGRLQRDRSGAEIDQGLFVSAVLANQRTGTHLCHAMLATRSEAISLAGQFRRDGIVKLPGATLSRQGLACVVTYANQRFLNAEDQATLDAMEICVALALPDVEMPDGNGYQACTNIRSLPGGADLPIVMVTGCDDTVSIDRDGVVATGHHDDGQVRAARERTNVGAGLIAVAVGHLDVEQRQVDADFHGIERVLIFRIQKPLIGVGHDA